MTDRFARWVLGLALCAILPTAAHAAVIYEEINASRFFNGGASPEVVGAGFDQIRGFINSGDEGDLYRVYFPADGDLTLRGRVTAGPLFPTLLVFDADGLPILARASGLNQVVFLVTITAGWYYIGFGHYPLTVMDTAGNSWEVAIGEFAPPPGFGVLDRLQNAGRVLAGNYRIDLSMATGEPPSVPEPTTMALLCGGLLVGGARFRRLRTRTRGPGRT
jgi:hypothetical protein